MNVNLLLQITVHPCSSLVSDRNA